ncbi:MAG TPA: tRNA pseudouridine(38-40) synthase TruA, partial [Myxococcales bacterium]|nr:tRNA pseudouridine(38-40) synthase TruA [Myxococcales bacterium]
REVRELSLRVQPLANGELIELRIEATAFLKHMVRNIVGTLVEVGHGKRTPASFAELLTSRDRTQAGPTAPPHGLVLDEVFYLPGNADPHAAEDDEGDE